MLDLAVLLGLTLASIGAAVWGYTRARRLHTRIETAFPGFNALMQSYGRGRYRD